jgi:hypothetical protein
MSERRASSTLRRQINEFGMHGGEVQESKIWAQIGKGLCVWLIWKYADALITHENVLFVLMLFLIFPELIKKFITMRYGGNRHSEYREHTESSRTITPVKDGELKEGA